MDLTDFYYENHFGIYPFPTEMERIKTEKTISYLIDNNYTELEIQKIISNCPKKDYLSYDDLPEYLWDNSLLQKKKFYYHPSLQILSKPPTFDPKTNEYKTYHFYIEMKIKYTIHDLYSYYKKNLVTCGFLDEKKDIGALAYLLKQYEKIDFIDPVDFILYMIDIAKLNEENDISLFNLDNKYQQETYKRLYRLTTEAEANNKNIIIFR